MSFNCCQTKKSEENIRQTIKFLKVISEKNRLRILCILQKKDLCVCDIWQSLDLSQNLVSHHLKILKKFDLVSSKKDGTWIIYSLNKKNTKKYLAILSKFI